MSILHAFALCLALTCGLHAQPQRDFYGLAPVRAAMKAPELSVSFIERQIYRMGDGIGIALLKLYSLDELRDEKLAKAYLPLIRMAFSDPVAVTVPENRKADVTLLLLATLPTDNWSPDLQREADELISFLKSAGRTATPRN